MSSQDTPSSSLTTRIGQTSEYDRLPECIRQYYTEREFEFLTDRQKKNLMKAELEPEYDE